MNRISRISVLLAAVFIFSVLALAARTASAAACPNKFGARKEVSGGDKNRRMALKELKKALEAALDNEADDCEDKACDEAKADCTFLHTVTKPTCKRGPGAPAPKIICTQKYRPGCFCLKDDEEVGLTVAPPAGEAMKK